VTRTPDHTHLAALLACVQLGLRHEIAQHLAGQPRAQHFDGDKTTGGGGSDPTATAATTPDKARHDLEQHDAAIDRAYRALLTLAALSDRYLPTHEPKRRQLIADTKGCALHERAGIEAHHPARCTTDFASGSWLIPSRLNPIQPKIMRPAMSIQEKTGFLIAESDSFIAWSRRNKATPTKRRIVPLP
jgi:hypothetical protein